MTFTRINEKTMRIDAGNKVIDLIIDGGNVRMETGTDAQQYRFPYPALRAYPILLNVMYNDHEFRQTVRFTYRIVK
jgi:hypothetical protein